MARMILPVPAGPGGRLESAEAASSSWISWDLMGSHGISWTWENAWENAWEMMKR